MSIKPLHDKFIETLMQELEGWKFISSHRHFRKAFSQGNWLAHIAFVNHTSDFDVVIDVAVEFMEGKTRLCSVGASLGNIEGVGQVRYGVGSEEEAITAASRAAAHLKRVGLPFLEHYSIPTNVIGCLKKGGTEALLISPLEQFHVEQIEALTKIAGAV